MTDVADSERRNSLGLSRCSPAPEGDARNAPQLPAPATEGIGGAERDRTRAAERHETPARRSRDEQPPTEGFPPFGTGRLWSAWSRRDKRANTFFADPPFATVRLWSGPYGARMPRVRPLPPPVPPPRGRLVRSKRFPSARSSSYPCRQSPASDAWSREGSIERPLRTSSSNRPGAPGTRRASPGEIGSGSLRSGP